MNYKKILINAGYLAIICLIVLGFVLTDDKTTYAQAKEIINNVIKDSLNFANSCRLFLSLDQNRDTCDYLANRVNQYEFQSPISSRIFGLITMIFTVKIIIIIIIAMTTSMF